MIELLHVYVRDFYIGELHYDRLNDYYSFIQHGYGKYADYADALLGIYRGNIGIHIGMEERFFPPDRINAREILDLLGLSHYDRWEIAKTTKGISPIDALWLSESKIDGAWFWRHHPLAEQLTNPYFKEAKKRQLESSPFYSMYHGDSHTK